MPTTTNYIWDEDNLLAEADGSNVVQTVYTNEPDEYGNLVSSRISGATSYHHFDAIGSTRQLTNSAGTVTDTVIYDAWGNVTNRTGTTGVFLLWIALAEYYFDVETDKVYIRQRIYDPVTARWSTRDPGDFRDDVNPYRYAHNRVIDRVDPSGLITITPGGSLTKKDCMTGVRQQWKYSLDADAPCEGYMVQHVTAYCHVDKTCKACYGTPAITEEFWEAWYVPNRKRLSKDANSNDTVDLIVLNKTCGQKANLGIFKFFCLDKSLPVAKGVGTGNLSTDKAWMVKYTTGAGACQISSGTLLGTGSRPPFWNGAAIEEGSQHRWAYVDWCCCPGAKSDVFCRVDPAPAKDPCTK